MHDSKSDQIIISYSSFFRNAWICTENWYQRGERIPADLSCTRGITQRASIRMETLVSHAKKSCQIIMQQSFVKYYYFMHWNTRVLKYAISLEILFQVTTMFLVYRKDWLIFCLFRDMTIFHVFQIQFIQIGNLF